MGRRFVLPQGQAHPFLPKIKLRTQSLGQVMNTQCHCGQVTIKLPGPPSKLNRCSCSICLRYGALWAYYVPEHINLSGPTDTYVWGDRMITFHRCQHCGVLTHWLDIDNEQTRCGINMQNMELHNLEGIPEYASHNA
jgi:hypothetical protein